MNGVLLQSLENEHWRVSFQPIKYLNFHMRLNVQCAIHLRYCCSIRIRKRYIFYSSSEMFHSHSMCVGNVLTAFAVDANILINKFMTFALLRIDALDRKFPFPLPPQAPAIHSDGSGIERSHHFVSTHVLVLWWIATNANAVVVAWQKAPGEIKFSQSYAFEQNVLLVSHV